ncbi:MAG: DUF192 domain-containing protein [Pseudomonadota bacterium]
MKARIFNASGDLFRVGVAMLILLLFVMAIPSDGLAGGGPTERLTIRTAEATHAFDVEIAATPDQHRTGLMYRRQLPANAGMLFLYENGSRVTMWMQNTYIPLDMLFVGADGRITHIVERTVPHSTELIGSNGPVRGVLELNGGTASRLGIRVGDQIKHPAFE